MFLKELNLGNEVKCTCGSCEGTGIYKGYAEQGDLAIICRDCNGRGYYTMELNEQQQLIQDEKKGVVYEVTNGIIVGLVKLFDKLQHRDDVKYVMYGTGRIFSTRYLFEHGASEINVIKYSEFIEGKLPLPMMQYTCPRQISQMYGTAEFDNNCVYGLFDNCEKFGRQECWKKFYGDAKTIEERQDVLRRVKKR